VLVAIAVGVLVTVADGVAVAVAVAVIVGVPVEVLVTVEGATLVVAVAVMSADALKSWLPEGAAVATWGEAPSPIVGATRTPPSTTATSVTIVVTTHRYRGNDRMCLLPPACFACLWDRT